MNPSDSRPARSAFAVGLYGPPSPDLAAGTGLSCSASNCLRMLSSLPRGCPAPLRSVAGAVYCLRRDMSGSANPTFRVFISRGCKVRLMLGLRTCSPPTSLTARCGLLTPHSDGEVSLNAQGLLRGAPALTATGLSPASLMQHESPRFRGDTRSGRTMEGLYQLLHIPAKFWLPRKQAADRRQRVRTKDRRIAACAFAIQSFATSGGPERNHGSLRCQIGAGVYFFHVHVS